MDMFVLCCARVHTHTHTHAFKVALLEILVKDFPKIKYLWSSKQSLRSNWEIFFDDVRAFFVERTLNLPNLIQSIVIVVMWKKGKAKFVAGMFSGMKIVCLCDIHFDP